MRMSLRRCLYVCATLILVVVVAGCAGNRPPNTTATAPATSSTLQSPSTTVTAAPTTSSVAASSTTSTSVTTSTTDIVPELSARQMAGQRVIFSYPGLNPPQTLISLISHGEVAGVVFFAENISSKDQLRRVINTLSDAAAAPTNPVKAPLLLMIDQEGGRVRHLPGEPVLSEKKIGQADDPPAEANRAGTDAGLNLHGVGLNVDLAPVLDVFRKAGGFDDRFERSYSSDPDVVSELGSNFIEALQEEGVAATAKHFPGLGAATRVENTDLRPVTLNVSKTSLRAIDELPYQAAIDAGVELVMVSWATYPALDAKSPAGFSSVVVGQELRDRLHFDGVTITDALAAGALKVWGTTQHRAILAAQAGMDLILCSSRNVSEGEQAIAGLQKGYADGRLTDTFVGALHRIIELRSNLGGREKAIVR